MLAPHANEIMALLPLLANNDPAAIWELIGAGPSRIRCVTIQCLFDPPEATADIIEAMVRWPHRSTRCACAHGLR